MTFLSTHKIEKEKTRSILNTLLFIICCHLIQVVFTFLAVGFAHYIINYDNFINLYIFSFMAYLIEIPVIIYFVKKWNINLLQEIKPINFNVAIILLLISVVIYLFNPIISQPISYFENFMNGKIIVFIPKNIEIDYLFIFSSIGYIIVAPTIEEIVYRGMVFNYLKRTFNLKIAIITSSLLFALVHFNFSGQGIIKLIYGFVFCIAYHKTKSITVPIVFHIIINLLSQVLKEQVIEATDVNLSRYIPSVILGILFILFLIKGMYKNKVVLQKKIIDNEN